MELNLRQQTLPYLEPAAAAIPVEESAECIVPDASPDIEQVLDSSGMVLLRSKECRDGRCSANGSIRVWVLYLAEGEQEPRRLELSIPFSAGMEDPGLSGESHLSFRGLLRNVDTRVVNPRKVSVRAALTAELQAWSPSQLRCSTGVDPDGDLQCRIERRRVVLPVAAGEKPFVVSDELELPAGQPPVRDILRWNAALELSDSRLVGEKAVFKGNAALEILYRSEQGNVEHWQTRMPFSQYLELPGAAEEDGLCVLPVLTGAELEPDGFGSRLQLTLNTIAQCMVEAQRELPLLTDLYSLHAVTTPQLQSLRVDSLLDRQRIRQDCRESLKCPASRAVAARVLLDPPTQRQEGDVVTISTEAQLALLYMDGEDRLQCLSRRVNLSCQTALAEGCSCRPEVALDGDVLCSPASEGVELRFSLCFTLSSYARTNLDSLASCVLTEPTEPVSQPSLIVRTAR